MIVNISYKDKDTTEEIEKQVGKSYGLIDRIKMGGIGSPRMLALQGSEQLMKYFHKNESARFCNAEIRPGGLIIRFRHQMDVMAWVIPRHHLSLYGNGDYYSIHGAGLFLKVSSGLRDGAGISRFIEKAQKTFSIPS